MLFVVSAWFLFTEEVLALSFMVGVRETVPPGLADVIAIAFPLAVVLVLPVLELATRGTADVSERTGRWLAFLFWPKARRSIRKANNQIRELNDQLRRLEEIRDNVLPGLEASANAAQRRGESEAAQILVAVAETRAETNTLIADIEAMIQYTKSQLKRVSPFTKISDYEQADQQELLKLIRGVREEIESVPNGSVQRALVKKGMTK